jgi:membrane-anchored protein YejM (alkaline phosphatase superfamily)
MLGMYPEETKHRAIVHYKYFLRSLRRVSVFYNVSKSTLGRWLQKDGVKVQRQKKQSSTQDIEEYIKRKLHDNPFLTRLELSKQIKSKSSVWKFIRSNDFTYKRTKPYISKPSIAPKEDEFVKDYYDNIISIDETFFYLYDFPRYGYSPKGTLLQKPYNHTPRKRKVTLYMATV